MSRIGYVYLNDFLRLRAQANDIANSWCAKTALSQSTLAGGIKVIIAVNPVTCSPPEFCRYALTHWNVTTSYLLLILAKIYKKNNSLGDIDKDTRFMIY